jgi:hypothetical protein
MNKIKTFFLTLIKSCTQPAYYAEVVKAKFSFSLKYLLVFQALFTVLVAVRLFVPISQFDLESAIKSAADTFPQDLVVSFENQELTINQPLPYVVPFPAPLFQLMMESGDPAFSLVTFTSDEAFQIKDFDDYSSLAVVTESAVYYISDYDHMEIGVFPFSRIEEEAGEEAVNFMVSVQDVDQLESRILSHPFIKDRLYLHAILAALLLLLYPVLLLIRVWTLMIYSVIVWLTASLLWSGKKLNYGKIFQIGIHALTPVVLAAWLLDWLGIFQLQGWWYLGAFLVWVMICLSQVKDLRKTKTISKKSKKAK